MPKERVTPPRAIRDSVMEEFRHRCAICEKDRPQVHHIDEDPSNNDPLNLIPLCPNHHLIDLHNPTGVVDPAKIKLFRQYKDPTILTPQFHPLFVRVQFLDNIADTKDKVELGAQAQELVEFVSDLEMGAFYSKQIEKLTKAKVYGHYAVGAPGEDERLQAAYRRETAEYREDLRTVREKVLDLVVELLRFQPWRHAAQDH